MNKRQLLKLLGVASLGLVFPARAALRAGADAPWQETIGGVAGITPLLASQHIMFGRSVQEPRGWARSSDWKSVIDILVDCERWFLKNAPELYVDRSSRYTGLKLV